VPQNGQQRGVEIRLDDLPGRGGGFRSTGVLESLEQRWTGPADQRSGASRAREPRISRREMLVCRMRREASRRNAHVFR
jgi:hypothetical protein